jgi:hypothetical protein
MFHQIIHLAESDTNALIKKGAEIQRRDIATLDRINGLLNNTKGIGAETLGSMHNQTNTMIKLHKGVNDISSTVATGCSYLNK